MEVKRLTDEQVLELDKILIEGNERIAGLRFCQSYRGRGGSNCSPVTGGFDVCKTLDELNGEEPVREFGMYLRAVVNDVVYLSTQLRSPAKVTTFSAEQCYSRSYEIAYDTEASDSIIPILK